MTRTTREIIENEIRAAVDNAVTNYGADAAAVLAILQQVAEDEAQYQADAEDQCDTCASFGVMAWIESRGYVCASCR